MILNNKGEEILKHIAIIPARGGSIGIVNKNLQEIKGKSLVRISWDSCVKSNIFSTVLLSSDSKDILREVCSEAEFNNLQNEDIRYLSESLAIHKRSENEAMELSNIKDLLFKLANRKELVFDFLWLIQPTTPFRRIEEFKEIVNLINSKLEWTSIVSVKESTQNHPSRMFELNNSYLQPYTGNSQEDGLPRQLLSQVLIKDGGYYVFKKQNLINQIFLGSYAIPFIRSSNYNVNIDTPEDLNYARYLADSFNLEVDSK